MRYQITPEQGETLVAQLQSIALDGGLRSELEELCKDQSCILERDSDVISEGIVSEAFQRMVAGRDETEINDKLEELFPKAYTRFIIYSYSLCAKFSKSTDYTCFLRFQPLTDDLYSIYGKEATKEEFIERFTKASKLGVNIFLDEKDYEGLQNCLYPVNHGWVRECLDVVLAYPTYTEEELVKLFDNMWVEEPQQSSVVLPIEAIIVPKPKKKSMFERMWGGG